VPLSWQFLNAAVRISSAGSLLGTGFIVSVASEDEALEGVRWGYVITAHHVIRHQIEIDVEIQDPFSGELQAPEKMQEWQQPLEGIDLALAPLPLRAERNYLAAHLELNVLSDEFQPLLGSSIYYVGIFAPVGRAMARSGTIGATEIPIRKSEEDYAYQADLVDCRSYEGFSGSPCYSQVAFGVSNEKAEVPIPPAALPDGTPRVLTPIYHQCQLSGMFTAHYEDPEDDAVVSKYGVGVMIGAKEIRRALMGDDAKADRRDRDRKLKETREKEGPALSNVRANPPGPRSRDDVLSDFEQISGPLRGHNRDQKPKA
jgi:hypothetical protein